MAKAEHEYLLDFKRKLFATCGDNEYVQHAWSSSIQWAVDIPFGLGVIRRGTQRLFVPDEAAYKAWTHDAPVDFDFYRRYRDALMNVVAPDAFLNIVEGWVT